MDDQNPSIPDPTLHLPRVLCLHGGGTNAMIFRAQCRVLIYQLKTRFRLCFADAPFPSSSAGPDVTLVYQNCIPFRRWLRWHLDHPEIHGEAAVREIENSLQATKLEDDTKGATGEWVGLMGFSQGAKVCASILLRQQIRAQESGSDTNYRFGILIAGRGPLVSLDSHISSAGLAGLADLSVPRALTVVSNGDKAPLLRLPTIHVHGLRDPGLELHRQLLAECCESLSTRLVEWEGDHRVPVKTWDVAAVVRSILDVARETGILADQQII